MAKKGQITVDEVYIVEVDSDPKVDGVEAPLSSIALLDNEEVGRAWIKTGPGNTDWELLARESYVKQTAYYYALVI